MSTQTRVSTQTRLLDYRTARALYGGVGLLAIANLLNQAVGNPFWTITRLIDLGSDGNAAAWYSSMLLLAAAWVSLECDRVAKRRKFEGRGAFLLLAGLLLLMSCDEIARFHEILGGLAADRLGVTGKSFAQHARWVWILGPVVTVIFVVVLIITRRALRLVPGSTRPIIAGFAAIVVAGVVLESTINWLNHDELDWIWRLEIILEESMEMMGTVSIIDGLIIWRNGADMSPSGPQPGLPAA